MNNLEKMDNNKIPTADEWLKHFEENAYPGTPITECMIEFAKMHVEAALKEASEKAFAQSSRSNFTSKDSKKSLICVHFGDVSINKDSILNSYSLDNIK